MYTKCCLALQRIYIYFLLHVYCNSLHTSSAWSIEEIDRLILQCEWENGRDRKRDRERNSEEIERARERRQTEREREREKEGERDRGNATELLHAPSSTEC